MHSKMHLHHVAKSVGCKKYKIWVDKGSEFYNKSEKKMIAKHWHGNLFNTKFTNI